MYVFVISFLASHIDTTVLSDRTYELIPDSEEGDQEAQLNAATLTEDPDQSLGLLDPFATQSNKSNII